MMSFQLSSAQLRPEILRVRTGAMLLLLAAMAVGCAADKLGTSCSRSADCFSNETCVSGTCQLTTDSDDASDTGSIDGISLDTIGDVAVADLVSDVDRDSDIAANDAADDDTGETADTASDGGDDAFEDVVLDAESDSDMTIGDTGEDTAIRDTSDTTSDTDDDTSDANNTDTCGSGTTSCNEGVETISLPFFDDFEAADVGCLPTPWLNRVPDAGTVLVAKDDCNRYLETVDTGTSEPSPTIIFSEQAATLVVQLDVRLYDDLGSLTAEVVLGDGVGAGTPGVIYGMRSGNVE